MLHGCIHPLDSSLLPSKRVDVELFFLGGGGTFLVNTFK